MGNRYQTGKTYKKFELARHQIPNSKSKRVRKKKMIIAEENTPKFKMKMNFKYLLFSIKMYILFRH